MNPFIHVPYYPDFGKMTPELAQEAVQQLLPEAKRIVDELEKMHEPTWVGLMQPLYDACFPLTHAWGLLSHLLSVMNNDAWRKVQQALQPEIVAFTLRVGQSPLFYKSFRALQAADAKDPILTRVQRRILEKTIQGATLAGVGLPPEKQERFNAIQTEIAQLATTFRNNVLDATKAFTITLTKADEVDGLPADLLAATVIKIQDQDAWKISLEASVYVPFMMHSKNRDAREKLYRAYVTRASSASTDNSPLIERLLVIKRELANLLDYPTYADLSLSTKSAKTVPAVDDLIEKLYRAAYPQGVKEMEALQSFALSLPAAHSKPLMPLSPWDISFYSERLRESKYDYSDEELSKYFPYPKVLSGLFALANRLFGIRIVDATGTVPVWHPDVKFYNVLDADGTCLAGIYSDPYSRPATKSGGAWANDFRTRRLMPDGTIQRPLALMVCNQSKPIGDKPPLMRFSEVRTLFHEFGHVLQHILTTVDEPEASGLNNIEWDAVEIASQFMENWCYDRSTLTAMSSHIDTGQSLPDALYKRMLAAQHFRAATTIMRQVTFAATDINLYARYPNAMWKSAHEVNQACIKKYSPTPSLPEDRFLCSFSHIFGGGYSAGYYSYKWSEVMSADAFSAFEEVGLENESAIRKQGKRYRDTLLALGGGTDPMEVFQQFRGRPPRIEALLRHAGLKS
ncbi:MAG: M3 family metallopeptidase [bacterium]